MAFFKLRKAAGEPQAPAPAPESVDAMRRRARYRLAGAALLVLAGVVGFPLLFDNQPRPIAVDIPIDIPDKTRVKPLVISPVADAGQAQASAAGAPASPLAQHGLAAGAASGNVAATAAAPEPKPAAKVSKPTPTEQQKEEVIISPAKSATVAPVPKSEDKPAAKAEAKAESKTAAKAADKPAEKAAEKTADKAAATGRFIVQFGAYTDSARAHEARLKVEKAGLKTYAQVVDGADGKKFRVRVGPFEKRSDAEKAADKIKKLDLPAAILGL